MGMTAKDLASVSLRGSNYASGTGSGGAQAWLFEQSAALDSYEQRAFSVVRSDCEEPVC